MKDRIYELMKAQGMTQQNFANELCQAPATLSSIFNGRTKPTNNIVAAIHERFPEVNISWLMFGEGDMYNDTASQSQGNKSGDADSGNASLSEGTSSPAVSTTADTSGSFAETLFDLPAMMQAQPTAPAQPAVAKPQVQVKVVEKIIDKPQRKITEIRVFYSDGTYETFSAK